MGKSLLTIAFEYVSSKSGASSFDDIWNHVAQEAGVEVSDAARKSRFYTNLMLDGRFVTLGDNLWDLRVNHEFSKVHIDMKDVYSDVETKDDDSEEDTEEAEYNTAFKETTTTDDDEAESSDEFEDESHDEFN